DKWVERAPKDWRAYFIRGYAAERGQIFRKAKSEYEHVLEMKPDHLDARLHLADILSNKKESAEALNHYEQGLRYHPDSVFLAIGQARCLVRLGREPEARPLLERLLSQPGAEAKRDLAEAYLLLGDLEWHQDQTAKALTLLRKASVLAPANPHVNRRLALLLRALGQNAEAQHYDDRANQADHTFTRLDQIIAELRQIGPAEQSAAKPRAVELRHEAGSSL